MTSIARGTYRTNRFGGMTKAEIVRTGVCPEHGFESDDFCGANENGWVFKCKGVQMRQENSWFDIEPIKPDKFYGQKVKKPRPIAHLFVNKPEGEPNDDS
jgi:hypothetical protein